MTTKTKPAAKPRFNSVTFSGIRGVMAEKDKNTGDIFYHCQAVDGKGDAKTIKLDEPVYQLIKRMNLEREYHLDFLFFVDENDLAVRLDTIVRLDHERSSLPTDSATAEFVEILAYPDNSFHVVRRPLNRVCNTDAMMAIYREISQAEELPKPGTTLTGGHFVTAVSPDSEGTRIRVRPLKKRQG